MEASDQKDFTCKWLSCIRLDTAIVPALERAMDADGPKHVCVRFTDSPLIGPAMVARYLCCVFVQGCSPASQELLPARHLEV
ncbi:hypothetical protein EV122DRAFT_282210 [Schizophyllum commune]